MEILGARHGIQSRADGGMNHRDRTNPDETGGPEQKGIDTKVRGDDVGDPMGGKGSNSVTPVSLALDFRDGGDSPQYDQERKHPIPSNFLALFLVAHNLHAPRLEPIPVRLDG